MRTSKIICFAVGAMWAATAACADEISIVSNVLGPEGPLYVDGNLLRWLDLKHALEVGWQDDYRAESYRGLWP
jgi:hypothetical protein